MKVLTNNKKTSIYNSMGSILAAGLLVFGAASCGQSNENREDTTVASEEAYNDDALVTDDGMQSTEQVTNTDAEYFNQYDRNTDQQWDRDEFNTSMGESQMFNDWDTDRNGSLSEEEFNNGINNTQNQNTATQNTTTGTTGTTTGTTGTATNTGSFSEWDTNRDGNVSQEEFNQGTFNSWDTNQDGQLSSDEYNMNNTGTSTGTGTDMNNTGTGTDMNNTGTSTDTTGTGTNTGTGTGTINDGGQ